MGLVDKQYDLAVPAKIGTYVTPRANYHIGLFAELSQHPVVFRSNRIGGVFQSLWIGRPVGEQIGDYQSSITPSCSIIDADS